KAAQDDSPTAGVTPATPTPAAQRTPPAPVQETGLPTVGQPQSTAPVSTDPLTAAPLSDAENAGGPAPSTQSMPGYTP
ncbi:MAG: hypothetical protein JWM84_1518, partial [Nocardioides sp.]|nr:hypothetical protein [Nocardioides sp.]